ncbi:MAG: S41 family peptidase [Calditrichia bacterium]
MSRLAILLISISLFCMMPKARVIAQPNSEMSTLKKSQVLDSLAITLKNNYAFPQRIASIVANLKKREQEGNYTSAKTPADFANLVTMDLQEITEDLHFHIGVDPNWIAEQRAASDPEIKKALAETNVLKEQQKNYGFEDVRILEGNIGYLNFTYFSDPDYAHETAEAAMYMLENSDALIIDQRFNNGGYMEMAQLLASYFFSPEPAQVLFDIYYFEDGKRIDLKEWVLPFVPGKRISNKPLYILTSSTTFSAGEWFAYVLKNLGRATVIGEQTAGGAHPVTRKPIDDQFFLQVPIGEIKGPVYQQDFEGEGVHPNIATPAYKALGTAHHLALKQLAEADSTKQDAVDWYLPLIAVRTEPIKLEESSIGAIVGEYEGRKIRLDGTDLIYSWGSRFRMRLLPLSQTLFALEGFDGFRFQVVVADGKTTGLKRIYQDKTTQFHRRIK